MSAPKEIVAATIGTLITNNRAAIKNNIDHVTDWIDRERVQFMASCDVGRHWEALANAPALFCIGADGKPLEAAK